MTVSQVHHVVLLLMVSFVCCPRSLLQHAPAWRAQIVRQRSPTTRLAAAACLVVDVLASTGLQEAPQEAVDEALLLVNSALEWVSMIACLSLQHPKRHRLAMDQPLLHHKQEQQLVQEQWQWHQPQGQRPTARPLQGTCSRTECSNSC